mgnify:CR=1 FL=1
MEKLSKETFHDSIKGHFAGELYNAMVDNPKVVVITADLGFGLWDKIRKDFPDRFYNVGAAELTAVTVAVGMSQEGLIPFVYSITPFLLFRGAEAIRNYVNNEKVNLKLITSGRSDDYSKTDGFSHYAGDDKLILQAFPNIQAFWPLTKSDMKYTVDWCVRSPQSIYVNLKR